MPLIEEVGPGGKRQAPFAASMPPPMPRAPPGMGETGGMGGMPGMGMGGMPPGMEGMDGMPPGMPPLTPEMLEMAKQVGSCAIPWLLSWRSSAVPCLSRAPSLFLRLTAWCLSCVPLAGPSAFRLQSRHSSLTGHVSNRVCVCVRVLVRVRVRLSIDGGISKK